MTDRGERSGHNGSHVRITSAGDIQVLTLTGELDMSSSDDLRIALSQAVSSGHERVIVDLRGLTFMDSMGLRALFEARTIKGSTTVQLIPGPPAIQRVFEVSGTADRFAWTTMEDLP